MNSEFLHKVNEKIKYKNIKYNLMFMLQIYYAVTCIIALPNICFVWIIISFFAGRMKKKN